MAVEETGVQGRLADSCTREETGRTRLGPNLRNDDAYTKQRDLEAEKEAIRPAVLKKIQRLQTETLQKGDQIRYCIIDDFGADKWPFFDSELLHMATPVIQARMKGETRYLDCFRQECERSQRNHGIMFGDTMWKITFGLPESENGNYEMWLRDGDPFARMPENDASYHDWTLTQDLDKAKTRTPASIYDIDVTQLADCGALVFSSKSLRLLCEIGNHFHASEAFFVDHLYSTSPLSDVHRSDHGPGPGGPSSFRVHMVGVMEGDPKAPTNIVFEMQTCREPNDSRSKHADQCDFRLSCEKLQDSFFVVAFNNPRTELSALVANTSPVAVQLPVLGPRYEGQRKARGGLDHGHLRTFFSDIWVLRRLSILEKADFDSLAMGHILLWLWAVWLYERDLISVALDVRGIDYECVTLSTSEALERIKTGRASIARLRKNLAQTRRAITRSAFRFQNMRYAYSRAADRHNDDCVQCASEDDGMTSRHLAASSVEDEYLWLEKGAADLMPLLNENLQIIIATINLEQSEIALNNAEVSRADAKVALAHAEVSRLDAEVSRRNGERSTQLTLLAAIYLPLTLATGVFGMNIKDINQDEVRYWWPIILAIVLMIPSAVVIAYIFWRSRQDRRRERERLHKGEKEA